MGAFEVSFGMSSIVGILSPIDIAAIELAAVALVTFAGQFMLEVVLFRAVCLACVLFGAGAFGWEVFAASSAAICLPTVTFDAGALTQSSTFLEQLPLL